jgi:hypothetical protein
MVVEDVLESGSMNIGIKRQAGSPAVVSGNLERNR